MATLKYSPAGARLALATLAREWTICTDLALTRQRLGEDSTQDVAAGMVVQDLALHALGADTWAWVEALRAAVGAERWSCYWSAFAALPITPARRLLAPRTPVRRRRGLRFFARARHRPLRGRSPRCRACGGRLQPREWHDRYCRGCLPF